MRFIGQNAELQQLSRFSDRSPDSLAVMYGRRRVGKSELLRQALKHSGLQYVFFECRQTSETQNLAALQATIGLQLSEPPLAFASLEGRRMKNARLPSSENRAFCRRQLLSSQPMPGYKPRHHQH